MGIKESFFVLDQPWPGSPVDRETGTEFYLGLDPATGTTKAGPAPKCPKCGTFIGSLMWLPPYEVEIECHGKQYGDIGFAGGELFVSERFKSLYDLRRLTGIISFDAVKTTRIKPCGRINSDPPQYYYVRVGRNLAAIDQLASGFEWEGGQPACGECRLGQTVKRWQRIVIDPNTWTGEDLFIPRGLLCIGTSARFSEFVTVNKITGGVLIPMDQYWCDMYPWENAEKGYEIMRQPSGGSILEKIKPNGDVIRYDTRINCLVIAVKETAGMRIKALFHPVDGAATWNRL